MHSPFALRGSLVQVRSIECKRQGVKEVTEGQSATFAVRSLNRRVGLRRSTFRKVHRRKRVGRDLGGFGGEGAVKMSNDYSIIGRTPQK